MRKELKKHDRQRMKFKGIVERYGAKKNYKGGIEKTILLKDITFINGDKATNHAWLTVGKTIEKAELKEGDKITFDARINTYLKGYDKDEWDYKLSHATKFLKQ